MLHVNNFDSRGRSSVFQTWLLIGQQFCSLSFEVSREFQTRKYPRSKARPHTESLKSGYEALPWEDDIPHKGMDTQVDICSVSSHMWDIPYLEYDWSTSHAELLSIMIHS